MKMIFNNSDKEWELYGKIDPYFGVLTDEKYSQKCINEENLNCFLHSGEEYCKNVIHQIHKNIIPSFRPAKILDYGCGVGRLLIPFAKGTKMVVGVDISPSMLAEAKKNIENNGIKNIQLCTVSNINSLPMDFDFVHSFIVFQHIPRQNGENLILKILSLLKPGGIAAIHVPFATKTLKVKFILISCLKFHFHKTYGILLKKIRGIIQLCK
jgi:2-polyprenyl-3-methyl-5-hydroxy-6-metoxy-1,4-benzoquinol methylase